MYRAPLASLSINFEKDVWHCFGCGKKGKAIDFEMAYAEEVEGSKIDWKVAKASIAELIGRTVQPFGSVYRETPAGIVWDKALSDHNVEVSLTNFLVRIVKDITEDDGLEQRHRYVLRAGKKTFSIPAAQYSRMDWVDEQLGAKAILAAGHSLRDHARAAIKTISAEHGIEDASVFTHTGWRKIGSQWFYLTANGAVGTGGLYEVGSQLPKAMQPFQLPEPPSGDCLKQAAQASLRLLDLGPRQVMFPAWAAIWRSVLGTCDFSEHFTGPSGAFKTELAVLLMQHFGCGFHRDCLPAVWSSTANAIEGLQFLVKDAIVVVDDFAPHGGRSDIDRYHATADRVFRGQGNNAGRSRLRRCDRRGPQ